MKLQHKYALTSFLLGTGFLLALTTIFYFQSRSATIHHARDLSETIVHENSIDIDEIIRDEISKTRSLIYSPFIIDAVTESNTRYDRFTDEERTSRIAAIEQQWQADGNSIARPYLMNLAANYLMELKRIFSSYYGELILTDRYGILVAASNRTSTFSQAGELWWETAYNGGDGKISVDDRGFDESVGDYVIGITIPVRRDGTTGDVIGLMKINLLVTNLISTTFHTIRNMPGSDLLIIRSGGTIVYDQQLTDRHYDSSLGKTFTDKFDLGDRGSLSNSVNGKRAMYTYEIVPLSAGTDEFGFVSAPEESEHRSDGMGGKWYVVHIQDLDTVLADVRETTITLIQIGLLFIFAMALLAVIAANSITYPVNRLIHYTRLIGQGNLETVIPMNSKDEIGTLAQAFNQMTLNLFQTMTSRDHLTAEIAQRQITETALRDSETRFHELFSNMSSGVVIYEPVDDGQDFIIKDMNRSGQQLSNVSLEEIRGRRVTEIFPGVGDIGLLDVFKRVNQTGEPEELPLQHYHDERLTEWVENYVFKLDTGEIVAVYDDITRRKLAELQFERIFNLSLDLVCIADFDGYFVKVNAAASSMLGYSEQELLEKPFYELIHPDDIERTQQLMEEKLSLGEPVFQFENRYRRKDGKYIWLSWVSHPVKSERHIYAIARDITKQKQAEEEIRKLARFPEENTNPVMRITRNGTIIYANKACEEILDYWQSKVGGTAPDTIFIAVEKALNTETSQMLNIGIHEVTYKLSLVPISDSGFVNLYAMDITDRIQAEQALKESEEKFRLISEQSLMGIAILQDNIFLYVNHALAQIYEQDFNNEENRKFETVQQLFHPDDLSFITEQTRKKQTGITNGIVHDYSYRIMLPDGRMKWIEQHSKTIMYGHRPADLITCLDITERKNIEQQMFQAQKMESVGRLAGGIAHDFNNLLTAIIGNAELALTETEPDSSSAEDLEEIKLTAERAAVLTKKLLAFSRRQIMDPKIMNINDVITDMDKMFRRLIGEHIDLKTVPGKNLWFVRIDPGQLEQVITNLVVNARDAIEKSGTITIETINVTLDKEYAHDHPGITPGEFVLLAVSDTGIGMNESTRSQIFEPFFTTKTKEKGTGLGLSTCYGIVHQNDGIISVYSEPGRGTTMKVYLPRTEGTQPKILLAPEINKDAGGTETILVVEDEPSVRKMISRILTGRGYRIIEAGNGQEALEIVQKKEQQIDLLVTDVVMPKMGGRELSERLAEIVHGLETLFISGYTENAIVHNGELEENINFLHKPFSPFVLAQKIRHILDGVQPESESDYHS